MKIVLLLKDDQITISNLKGFMSEDFETISSKDLLSAFKVIKTLKPSMVVLNVALDNKEMGLDLAEMLMKDGQTSVIPFIFYTGTENLKDIEESISLGGLDFISKTRANESVRSMIQNFSKNNH